ncbi:LysR family transcriptional regulator [Ectopseudomonas khazarica]|uniref:LysR family transcriptional regulator n=1 Tax=Ectopseudomonas khazarica TaxID=2502979 RepID=UPI00068FCAB5
MKISLRVLTYFEAVAEAGSVTTAASMLHISQPSVSTALRELEEQLAVTLFVRHHARGLTLTPAGRQVLAYVKPLLAHARDFERAAGTLGTGREGDLKVACCSTLAPFVLPRLCSLTTALEPALRLTTSVADHDELYALLREGAVELGIGCLYEDVDDILAVTLGHLPPHVLVASDHPLASRRAVRLSDLRNEPFILLDLPRIKDYFLSLFRSCAVLPSIRHANASYETVRGLVACGQGYTVMNALPTSPMTYVGREVVALEIIDRLPPLHLASLRIKQGMARTSILRLEELCQQELDWSCVSKWAHPSWPADP